MKFQTRRQCVSQLTKRLVAFICIFMFVQTTRAVSLHIGEYYKLSAYPPDGYITSSSWSSNVGGALNITDYGEGVCLVSPAAYFSGTATVECFFTYTYVEYDYKGRAHNHVGYKSQYFSITCVTPTLTLQPSQLTIQPGESAEIKAIVRSGGQVRESLVQWTTGSSYSSVIETEYSTGTTLKIKGVSPGTETVTANIGGGLTATCTVTVGYITPETISLPNDKTIKIGQTITLTPTFTPSGANSDLTWRSSDTSVASVSSSGAVKGLAEGTTTITVSTTNGLSASCLITVYKPVPISIQFAEKSLTIPIEGTQQLTYTVNPSDAIYTVDWQSDSPDIASVDKSGFVTAHSEGMACITVITDNGVSDRCVINVPPLPKRVYLPDSLYISLRNSYQLEYRQRPEDALSTYYRWQSSDQDVVTVTDEGLVKAVGVGEAEVSLQTGNGLEAVCVVVVIEPLYNLVVWTKDSVRTDFSFADKPQITMSGDVFTVTSQKISVEYNALDIDKFTLDLANETAGDLVYTAISVQKKTPHIIMTPDMLTISGCSPLSNIAIYGLNAKLMAYAKTNHNGEAQFLLAGWPRGIYIVKTESTTFKVTKK